MKTRIKRLKEISSELHDLANSFAGDETGTAAANLHGAASRVNNSIRMLETGITEEDKKKILREHFKGQLINKNKTDVEIEYLVDMFSGL